MGAIDVTRIAFAQREYRTTPNIVDTSVLTRHPLAVELDYNTLFRTEADATTFGNEILALRKLDRWTWACYVRKEAYVFQIGQTITLTYPRFDLDLGKNFIVKRVKIDSNALYDELTLFGPQT